MLKDLVLTTPPATKPVSRAEMKRHLDVEHDEDDELIDDVIDTVVQHLDGYTGVLGRCLISQVWTWYLDAFPGCRELRLPLPELLSVGEITCLDSDGVAQVLPADRYTVLDGRIAAIALKAGQSWLRGAASAGP